MLREPVLPDRPPRSCLGLCRLKPGLRRKRLAGIQPGADAVASSRVQGAAHDAGVMTAGRQQEGVVSRARQAPPFKYRLPRRDVIAFRADDEHRCMNAGKIDTSAVGLEFAPGKRVVEVE